MKGIVRSEKGAVMVFALFAAMFLVGLMYHIIGVGEAAIENQLMQDTADSVAYSGATVVARGMNTIAIINMFMALILAVLVALRLIIFILVIGIAMAGVGCAIPWSALFACPLLQGLKEARDIVKEMADQYEEFAKNALNALHTANEVVEKVTPVVAQAEAIVISQKEGKGVSTFGMYLPMKTLPVEDGEFKDLCIKAGNYVGGITLQVFTLGLGVDSSGGGGEGGFLGNLIGKFAGTFSSYFCGDGGEPSRDEKYEVGYPTHVDNSCEGTYYERFKTDPEATVCDTHCIKCSALACTECIPKLGSDMKAIELLMEEELIYEYYTDIQILYFRRFIENKKDEPRPEDAEAHSVETEPSKISKKLSKSYDWKCRHRDNFYGCDHDPICSYEKVEFDHLNYFDQQRYTEQIFGPGYEGKPITHRVKRTIYKYERIFSCVVNEKITGQENVDALDMDNDDWKPAKVLVFDDYKEGFKLKSIVIGKGKSKSRLEKIGVFQDEHDIPEGAFKNRFGFAASTYESPTNTLGPPSDNNEGWKKQMWIADWNSRLIRFSLKDGSMSSGSGSNMGFDNFDSGNWSSQWESNEMGGGFDFIDETTEGADQNFLDSIILH